MPDDGSCIHNNIRIICQICNPDKYIVEYAEINNFSLRRENDFLIQCIKFLENEIGILHMKDGTLKAIGQLNEIANSAPITRDVQDLAKSLNADLAECFKSEENFYLRKRIGELERDLSRAPPSPPTPSTEEKCPRCPHTADKHDKGMCIDCLGPGMDNLCDWPPAEPGREVSEELFCEIFREGWFSFYRNHVQFDKPQGERGAGGMSLDDYLNWAAARKALKQKPFDAQASLIRGADRGLEREEILDTAYSAGWRDCCRHYRENGPLIVDAFEKFKVEFAQADAAALGGKDGTAKSKKRGGEMAKNQESTNPEIVAMVRRLVSGGPEIYIGKEWILECATRLEHSYLNAPDIHSEAFQSGVLWAGAWLCQAHDKPSIAKEMIETAGADPKKADMYDRNILRKAGIL